MVRSMTGYGTGSCQTDNLSVVVEARAVNHRFFDLHLRIPREYLFLEPEVQQVVRGLVRRGRVELNVGIQASRRGDSPVDLDAARTYMEAAARLREELHVDDSLDLKTLLGLPGVVSNRDLRSLPAVEATAAAAELVVQSVRQALEGVIKMRELEGEALRKDLGQRLEDIAQNAKQIRALAPEVAIDYRQRLTARLAQIVPQDGVDAQRLAQEVALVAERCDVSEELTRLESHLDQFSDWMTSPNEVGKRMDFLLQEMQRETNTILSKTAHLEITRAGVAIKVEIEKLREQVQNVE
jgi:uncharacterized protein (TIGR00255 family)